MAQDFGDDMGEILLRSTHEAARRYMDWMRWNNRNQEGQSDAPSKESAESPVEGEATSKQAQQMIYLPFGDRDDASYFAQVCRENKIDVDALQDAAEKGYIRFQEGDLKDVEGCTDQFAEVMTRLTGKRISETLAQEPLTEEVQDLKEISHLPELSTDITVARDAPLRNHTQEIRDVVLTERDQCSTFDDFEQRLAQHGIGLTNTRAGEVMFYEARSGSEGLLPFGKDANGKQDWAVSANTLKARWGVDATYDWFEKNRGFTGKDGRVQEQVVTDGALDSDGRTPDADQGIKSHDGMDTDARTARMEREQSATDVPPSVQREAERISLASEARDMREASKQLAQENGIRARDIDLSDKLNPVR